ncbi:MAG: hypothetical protein K2Q22_08770, partial [Cytophagales bacterium]|nr:hypothetical protein [Cytophagales bacterium]
DANGLQPKSYLPYISSQSNGAAKSTDITNPTNAFDELNVFYSTNTDPLIPKTASEDASLYPSGTNFNVPYSESKFESSPRARLLEKGSAGVTWQVKQDGSGKTNKFRYWVNDDRDKVLYWLYEPSTERVSANLSSINHTIHYFRTGTLTIEEIEDADGHIIQTFSTHNGQKILSRQVIDEGQKLYYDTYYIYDDMGWLRYIVPPKAVQKLTEMEYSIKIESDFANDWLFYFRYDERGRVIEKHVPGVTELETFVYDQLDRTVFHQSPLQKNSNTAGYQKYDVFGRVIMSGKVVITSRAVIQASVNAQTHLSEKPFGIAQAEGYLGTNVKGYTNNTLPSLNSNTLPQQVHYYDGYDFNGDGANDYTYDTVGIGIPAPVVIATNLKGLKTGYFVDNNYTYESLGEVYFYDRYKRLVHQRSRNVAHSWSGLSTVDKLKDHTTFILDFAGRKMRSSQYTATGSATVNYLIRESFRYDHAGRLISRYHKINSKPQVLLASYKYNKLGQLIEKNLHSEDGGSTFLQSVDFRYNIKGWLRSINNSRLANDMSTTADANVSRTVKTNNDGNDLFGMEIHYDTPIQYSNGSTLSAPFYNGLASAITWNTNIPVSGSKQKFYTYGYDKAMRLALASYGEKEIDWTRFSKFAEAMNYDANGNISTLTRYDGSNNLMDQLTYTYQGNKLTAIADASDITKGFTSSATSQALAQQYTYNTSGSMVVNANRDTEIQYSTDFGDGQPVYVRGVSNPNIVTNFFYDHSGKMLVSYHTGNGHSTYQLKFYAGGFHFLTTEETPGESHATFFNTAEGYVKVNNDNTFDYVYQISDHLGSPRVFFHKKPSTNNEAEILQAENYYALGLRHGGGNSPVYISGEQQNILYSGKELYPEVGYIDYGARQYDPIVGRWWASDPSAEKYESFSPYAFCGANPVSNKEIDGKEFVVSTYGENGKVTGTYYINSQNIRDYMQGGSMYGIVQNNVDLKYAVDAINYLGKADNPYASQLYNFFSQPLSQGGIYYQLGVNNYKTGFNSTGNGVSYDNPLSMPMLVSNVNLLETSSWIANSKLFFQSSSVNYLAHEMGHAFDYFMQEFNTNGTRYLKGMKYDFANLKGLYDNLLTKTGSNNYEAFGTTVQNAFANGLGQPIKPSYTGTSSTTTADYILNLSTGKIPQYNITIPSNTPIPNYYYVQP